ncbi:MAG: hypothetical protein LBM70_00805 [Victivallales bacterium]|jgi:lipopolysaccharide export system protein LptA|nr:hypothetical protein [Victivallales bacterium]
MKIFLSLIIAGILSLSGRGADELGNLRGLVLTHFKLPVRNQGNLQMMVFCNKVERSGRAMVGTDTVLDLIQRGADVDLIRNGWNLKAYALDAKLPEILEFWKERPYSEGVILTPLANIDQENRMAYGEDPVFFRSPLIDLNGIGFEADFTRRSVLVKEDVNIVLRMNSSDPRRILAATEKLPKEYEFVTATSNSLRIDMAANQIVLTGDVEVNEANSIVNCNRMTIFLDRQSDKSDFGGVSRVLCDGDVVITRKISEDETAKGGTQKAFADHLTYDPVAGTVVLTGEKRHPILKRGQESLSGESVTLHNAGQRAVIRRNSKVVVFEPGKKPGDSGRYVTINSDDVQLDYQNNFGDFIGNVLVNDPRMQLECSRMRINLKETQKAGQKAISKNSEATLSGVPDLNADGQRELDKIFCDGDVKVVRRDATGKLLPNELGTSQNAVFDYATGTVTMSGKTPTLMHNTDSLSGDELIIWVNSERISARKNSKVTLGDRGSAENTGGKKGETVILSDFSDLNYGKNLLVFSGNVKVRDERVNLDCDKMEIFLQATKADQKASAKGVKDRSDIGDSGDRDVKKVFCQGKVHAIDSNSDLRCDKLTLHFSPQSSKVKTPGMFQSGNTELTLIEADGNVEIVNTPNAQNAQKKQDDFGKLLKGDSSKQRKISADCSSVDFRKQITEFHRNVYMRDEENSIKCDDMYLFAGKALTLKDAQGRQGQNIDDDPFVLSSAETVPARINLTEHLDLKRVICRNNVRFVRRTLNGDVQRAGGYQADYLVANREIIVTEKPGKQPWMSVEGRRMYADRIIVDVANESMQAEGNTSAVAESSIKN